MPFSEIVTVYCKNHTILTALIQTSELLNAEPGGTYTNQYAIKWQDDQNFSLIMGAINIALLRRGDVIHSSVLREQLTLSPEKRLDNISYRLKWLSHQPTL
jgi:hypothetical protein